MKQIRTLLIGIVLGMIAFAFTLAATRQPEQKPAKQQYEKDIDQFQYIFFGLFWPGVAFLVVAILSYMAIRAFEQGRKLKAESHAATIQIKMLMAQAEAQIKALSLPGDGLGNFASLKPFYMQAGNAAPPQTLHDRRQIITNPAPALPTLPQGLSLPAYQQQSEPPTMPPAHVDLVESLRRYQPDPRKMEIVLAQTAHGAIIKPFGQKTLHFGTIGATGSGKTAFTQSVLTTLALHDPAARRINFFFSDAKQSIFKPFQHDAHTISIATDALETGQQIKLLKGELITRMRRDPRELNEASNIIFVIDEFMSLKRRLKGDMWDSLIDLIEQGRAAKIYFMLLAQNLYAENDVKSIRAQLRTRTMFAIEDIGTAAAFGYKDTKLVEKLQAAQHPGLCLIKTETGAIFAQAPYIAPEQIPVLLAGNQADQPRTAPRVQTVEGARPTTIEYQYQPAPASTATATLDPMEYYQPPSHPASLFIPESYRQTQPATQPASHPATLTEEQSEALAAYKAGSTGERTLAAALGCGRDKASRLLNELETIGAIPPRPRRV